MRNKSYNKFLSQHSARRRKLRLHAAKRADFSRADTSQLEPGIYPSNWNYMGVKNAYSQAHYLHSTVRGFNADYQQMTDVNRSLIMFDKLYNDQHAATQRQIDLLIQAAQAAKSQLGLRPDQDIMESNLCQLLYKGNSIYNQVRELSLKLKKAEASVSWADIKSGKHKQDLHKVSQQMLQYMNDMTTLMKDNPDSALHKVKLFTDFIDHTIQELQKDHPKVRWTQVESVNDSPENLHQHLGFVWEEIIGAAYIDSVRNTVNEGNIIRALTNSKNYHLSDLLFGKPVDLTLTGTDERASINVGISAKFTNNGSFKIKGNNAAITPQEILTRHGIPLENNPELDTLAYIYDNYTALTIFEADRFVQQGLDSKMGKGSRKEQRQQYRRNETLQRWPSVFRQIFQKFSDFAYLAIISGAFFGNSADYGNTSKNAAAPVFNPDYTDEIIKNLNGNSGQGLPAFIFTSTKAYETGKLLKIIFDRSNIGALSDASIVIFQTLFSAPSWGIIGDFLKEMYESKCEALNLAADSTNGTIYGILRNSKAIFGVSDWHPFHSIMKRRSRIKFEFDPTQYLK